MMSPDEQTIIEIKLAKLSARQLVEIWDSCGIAFASPQARRKAMSIDPAGLIAPILADCAYQQALAALQVVAKT